MISNNKSENVGINLQNLIKVAATFSYEVAESIKEGHGEEAQVLALVLKDDPSAEFHVSVCLAPFKRVVLSVVTEGKQFIFYDAEVSEDGGIKH